MLLGLLSLGARAQTMYDICFGEEGQEYCVEYPAGSSVKISVPSASKECYHFEQWMDGNTDNPRTVVVTQDSTFTATYALNDINVVTSPADAALGSTSGDGTFKCGTDVTITATAAEHYHFIYWEKDGAKVSESASYTFEVKGNHNETVTYVAYFAIDSVYVNVQANDDTKGTVEQSHSSLNTGKINPFTYEWWTEGVTVSATVTDGCYRFESWSDGSTENPHQLPSLEQDTINITANFVPRKDTLTIKYLKYSVDEITIANGDVISESDTETKVAVDCGTEPEITVTANRPCYVFSGWDLNNDNTIEQELDSTEVTITHTESALTSNRTITLMMRKAKFHVKIVFDPEQGTPWWAPGRPGETNDEWIECQFIQLSNSPKACYNFDHWQYGNDPRNTGTEWNGIYISSDTTFYAFYKEKSWNITFGPNEVQMGRVEATYSGSAATSPLPTMHCDSTFTLIPIANEGYRFLRWSDGNTDSVRNIVVDNETPMNFTAIFAPPITLTLRAQLEDGGLGGGEFENVVATTGTLTELTNDNPWSWYAQAPTEVSFSAKAESDCYEFKGWSDGETSASRTISLSDTVTYTALFKEKKYEVEVIILDAADNTELSRQTEEVRCTEPKFTWSYDGGECNEFVEWSDGTFEEHREFTNIVSDSVFTVYYTSYKSVISVQSADYHGTATIQETGTASAERYCGETLTLVARSTGGQCYEFKQWDDGNTDSIRTITVGKENKTYTASFGIREFTLSLSASPAEAATVAGGGTFECGEVIKGVKATPASDCYEFTGWSDGETELQHSDITMSCDKNLVANFKKKTYTLTVDVRYNGNAVDAADLVVNGEAGNSCTFECSPGDASVEATIKNGYCFVGWDINNDGQVDPGMAITDSLQQTASCTATATDVNTVITLLVRPRKCRMTVYTTGSMTDTTTNWFDFGSFHQIYNQAGQCNDVTRITAGAAEREVWSISTGGVYGFTLVSDTMFTRYISEHPVYVRFAPNDATYGRVDGESGGQTYSSPMKVYCGDTITLVPVAADHSRFVGWSDGVTDSVRTIYVDMPMPTDTYTAVFAPEKERLTLNAVIVKGGAETGNGGGVFVLDPLPNGYTNPVAGGTYVYSYQEQVEVSPVAESGYRFIGWKDTNDSVRSLTMTEDMSLTALFEKITYTVTVVTNPAGAATAITDKTEYEPGETVKLSLSVSQCYTFASWADGTTDINKTFVISSDTTLYATLAVVQYTFTVNSADSSKGTASGGGTYTCGSEVTATATPAANYRFLRWQENDSRQNPYSFTLSGNTTMTAEFEEDKYSLTVNVEPSGTATVSGGGTYFNGSDVTVQVTPDDCRKVVSWSDNAPATDTRTIHLVSDTVITVYTDKQTYTCTINLNPAEAGAPTVQTMSCGESYNISAPEVYGWHFISWEDGTTGQRYIGNAQGDTTFTANYERELYTVTVDCDATRGTVAGGGTYLYDDVAQLVATPDSGYQFVGWSDGTTDAVYNLRVESDTTLTAFFRIIPFTIYVIQEDTVCIGEDYTLPSGTVVPYPSAATLYVDSTDFEYEQGVWCKRIFTITLYPSEASPEPRISVLPEARAGEPLSLTEATESSLSDFASRAAALSPAAIGYYWELQDLETGRYEQYRNTSIPEVDFLTLRFVVVTPCQVLPSQPVTIPVGPKRVDPYGYCISVVYMNVDADTTILEIDTKRMFHLGFNFSETDVAWYKVIGKMDDAEAEVVDDEFIAEGYTLPLSRMALHDGEYYARISLPEQTELVPCSDVLCSDAVQYTAATFDDFLLVPNQVKSGEVMTLLGLKDTDVATIRVYDSTGHLLHETEVSNTTYFDYQTTGNSGVYMMRVQTEDRKKTLKFFIK